MVENSKIPQHVAIVMDGNGRWAQNHGMDRLEGHTRGIDSVRKAINAALWYGIRYLTLYVFSTENRRRPAEEVEALMSLLCECAVAETANLVEKGVSVRIIGDRSLLSEEVRDRLLAMERDTSCGNKLTLLLAIDYGSRAEITAAARRMAEDVRDGRLDSSGITAETVGKYLYTAGIPDPDLLIRTGGEHRLSNFLLWQAAYSELYFTDIFWPDFGESEFDAAIISYARRERRFGLIKNQILSEQQR